MDFGCSIRNAFVFSVILSALPACQQTPLSGADTNPVGRQDHTLTVDGLERQTIVYVGAPAAAIDAPVVFVFHGTSQDGEKFYSDSLWREKADAEGFIAVFPTALTYCYKEDENRDGNYDVPGEMRVSTKWSNGRLGEVDGFPLCDATELAKLDPARRAQVEHPFIDDVVFVDAMLELLGRSYRIDKTRVYATGFSNGASFTSRLAQERSQRFAAAAPGSGTLAVTPALAPQPMDVVHWVGSKDDRFIPVEVTIKVDESLLATPYFKSRFVTPMLTTLGLADAYTYSERLVGSRTIATFTYATSTTGNANTYSFSVIEGMFHIYPSGTPAGLSAADFAWDVFATKSLPTP